VNLWASVALVPVFRIRNHPVGIEGVGDINSHIWRFLDTVSSGWVSSTGFSVEDAVRQSDPGFP